MRRALIIAAAALSGCQSIRGRQMSESPPLASFGTRCCEIANPVRRGGIDFSAAAMKAGIHDGWVILRLDIEGGTARNPTLISSSHPAFERTAIAASQGLEFEASVSASRCVAEFRFALQR